MIRDDHLHMFTHMRSNDAYWGLPHDVFAFTMLQEIVACDLSVELGIYHHSVGSMHLYAGYRKNAERFLSEGWQSTAISEMPSMPYGDPWGSIGLLLEAEKEIRLGQGTGEEITERLPDYWADLVRLLRVFGLQKEGRRGEIPALRSAMTSDRYDHFIEAQMKG